MPFPPDQAKIISIFIQTLLYGAYTVLFVLTSWVLVSRRPRGQPVHKVMFGTSLVMFTLATMHIAVNFTRIWKAFIVYRDEQGGPAAFFLQLSEFTQIFGSTIYIAQTLAGDGVVLYRCYVVWGRRFFVVAFPCLLYLGSSAAGVGILYTFAVMPQTTTSGSKASLFRQELQKWIVSFFSMTFATNVICTGLVAFRIWYINRKTVLFTGHSLRPVLFLVVESGAVYSATLLTLLILYKVESWFQYVLLDAVSPIVGLVFSMIIIRIGLGITSAEGETTIKSRRWTFSSENEASGLDFGGQIALGPLRGAPHDSVLLGTGTVSNVPPTQDRDDKSRPEAKKVGKKPETSHDGDSD